MSVHVYSAQANLTKRGEVWWDTERVEYEKSDVMVWLLVRLFAEAAVLKKKDVDFCTST